jgi:hypothetical protein
MFHFEIALSLATFLPGNLWLEARSGVVRKTRRETTADVLA